MHFESKYHIVVEKKFVRYQEYRWPAGVGLVHTHVRERVMFIIEDSTVTAQAAFAVGPTDTICGRSLSSKKPVDMNSIFIKLMVTYLRNLNFRSDFGSF